MYICISMAGEAVCQEYFQVDAPDKFFDGWLVTGDVAKIDEEGAIVISDRSKDVLLAAFVSITAVISMAWKTLKDQRYGQFGHCLVVTFEFETLLVGIGRTPCPFFRWHCNIRWSSWFFECFKTGTKKSNMDRQMFGLFARWVSLGAVHHFSMLGVKPLTFSI